MTAKIIVAGRIYALSFKTKDFRPVSSQLVKVFASHFRIKIQLVC